MYILTPVIFIKILTLTILIISIPAVMLHIMVRRQTSLLSSGFKLTAVLIVCGLFFLFMKTAAFDTQLQKTFILFASVFFVIFFVALILTLFRYISHRNMGSRNPYLSPDLAAVYRFSDDIVLILDWQGRILDVNHEEGFRQLAGQDVTNIEDLPAPDENDFYVNITRSLEEWECYLTVSGQSFLVMNTPIITKNSPAVGSVMVLHCITEEKEYERVLLEKNDNLEAANKKLEKLVKMNGMLKAEQAKARLLQRVQTELTGRIEGIIADIRDLTAGDNIDSDESKKRLRGIIDSLRGIYKKVRDTIQSIQKERLAHDKGFDC